MPKLPSIHLYPGDWLRDDVAGCSLAAQGLWLRMMFIGHDSERYGYLQKDGAPIPPESIARRCGCTPEQYEALLLELDRAGVPSRTPEGVIYSRRMVRDGQERAGAADRQRRHRGRGGGSNGAGINGASNGRVTPQSHASSDTPVCVSSTSASTSRSHTPSTPSRGAAAKGPPGVRPPPAGVGVSEFKFEQIHAWAKYQREKGAQIDPFAVATARWRDGTADAEVRRFLERTPEQIARERAAPAEQQMGFAEAAQYVASLRDAGQEVSGYVAEMDVDEDVRAKLRERFCRPAAVGQ